MDFDCLFPFNAATDCYNCDLEVLVRDEKERQGLSEEYKRRLCNNKEGQRKYTAIIKKQSDNPKVGNAPIVPSILRKNNNMVKPDQSMMNESVDNFGGELQSARKYNAKP